MKITTYKYEKVAVKDTELFIPQEPFYCFETGIRRAIRIIPMYTTWLHEKDEEEKIYSLDVTCVYQSGECKIEIFSILISQVEHMINVESKDNETSIMKLLLTGYYNTKTKDNFEDDLEGAIDNIKRGYK